MAAPVVAASIPAASYIVPSAIGAFSSLLGAGMSQSYNERNMNLQEMHARSLAKYQWDNFTSPQAQVASLRAAGMNPAAMAEGGKVSGSAPSINMPSSAPVSVPGIFDISALAQMIHSIASAKKAGADVPVAEETAKNIAADTALKNFQNELNQLFGKEFKSVELAQSYRNLLLLADSHDLNEIEKAIGEYKKETEKAVASAKGSEAQIIRQRLENNPTLIALENKLKEEQIKTEKSVQANQYASASNSRELRRLNAALADIEETGKQDKIKALLNKYKAENQISDSDYQEALLKMQRLHDVNWVRDASTGARILDDLLEYLKEKVSIFKSK